MMSRIRPRIITMTSTTAVSMSAIYPAGEAYASVALEPAQTHSFAAMSVDAWRLDC
jgi:hypothetical protein